MRVFVGRFVELRLFGQVLAAQFAAAAHVAAHRVDGLTREVGRVGTHVGDQARLAAGALQVDAFVELLGHAHGAPQVEAQAGAGLLLQGAGDKRRRRAALGPLGVDAGDGEVGCGPDSADQLAAVFRRAFGLFVFPGFFFLDRKAQRLGRGAGGFAVGGLKGLAVELGQVGPHAARFAQPGVLVFDRAVVGHLVHVEILTPRVAQLAGLLEVGREEAGDLPVLVGDKRVDLALAFDHQPGGDRLHAAGAQAAGDLLPQQRRHLITHDAVEDAAGLLGVDAVDFQRPRFAEGFLDRVFGDGVEDHTLGVFHRVLQRVGAVPGDGFPFAVEVGREPDVRGPLGGFLKLRHRLGAVGHHLVGGLEVVVQINPRHGILHALGVAAGQVADVAHAGHDQVVRAQVLVDRLGLGGAFHDHQVLALGVGLGDGAACEALGLLGRRLLLGDLFRHRGGCFRAGVRAADRGAGCLYKGSASDRRSGVFVGRIRGDT